MTIGNLEEQHLIAVTRLTRDLRRAAAELGEEQVRFYVDTYYNLQKLRIGAAAQGRSAEKQINDLVAWTTHEYETMENQVKTILGNYAESRPVGLWSLSQIGIGPVIAAGLLAHIDITKASTAGKLWRYAGLDPTVTWEKKQKRPWNARLKVLCWKAGQSFVKFSNHERCYYGKIYQERKYWERLNNDEGAYAMQAQTALRAKNYSKDTDAYKAYAEGKLPPAHIQARAERYAVKIFLSHWHAVAFEVEYGKPPGTPWIIAYDPRHTHVLSPPNWPLAM